MFTRPMMVNKSFPRVLGMRRRHGGRGVARRTTGPQRVGLSGWPGGLPQGPLAAFPPLFHCSDDMNGVDLSHGISRYLGESTISLSATDAPFKFRGKS